jgi:hypothetical protein
MAVLPVLIKPSSVNTKCFNVFWHFFQTPILPIPLNSIKEKSGNPGNWDNIFWQNQNLFFSESIFRRAGIWGLETLMGLEP